MTVSALNALPTVSFAQQILSVFDLKPGQQVEFRRGNPVQVDTFEVAATPRKPIPSPPGQSSGFMVQTKPRPALPDAAELLALVGQDLSTPASLRAALSQLNGTGTPPRPAHETTEQEQAALFSLGHRILGRVNGTPSPASTVKAPPKTSVIFIPADKQGNVVEGELHLMA